MQTLRKNALTIVFGAFMLLVVLQFREILSTVNVVFSALSTILIGFAIAFILNLPMAWLEKTLFHEKRVKSKFLVKSKRGISIVMTVLLFLVVIVTLSWFIFPQLLASIPSFVSSAQVGITETTVKLLELLDRFGIKNEQIVSMLDGLPNLFKNITNLTANTLGHIFKTALNISAAAMNIFLGFIMAIYMLSTKENLLRSTERLTRALFSNQRANYLCRVADRANFLFSKFIGGQLTEAVILGTLCFIGMSIFRFPYALLVSTLIGFTALIPYVGAFLGTIPSVIIISLVSLPQGIGFLIFILLLQQIDGNFIYPKVVGDAIGLDGFWVLVAISVGGALFGMLGMLISVPVVALLQSLIHEWVETRLADQGVQLEEK